MKFATGGGGLASGGREGVIYSGSRSNSIFVVGLLKTIAMHTDNNFLLLFFQKNGLTAASVTTEAIACFEEKEITKNSFHLRERMISDEYMIVERGFLRAYTHDVDGNEVTTGFYSPGNLVLEPASFFHRTPSKENVQALIDSKGWVITFEKLNALFHAHVAFREFGRSLLVKGFAALKERMLSTITETAEQRYLTLLQNKPDIFQQAALKHIASYLGVTDTSLSRIRKELSRK
jgi:CRP-like cAMP-binding protein